MIEEDHRRGAEDAEDRRERGSANLCALRVSAVLGRTIEDPSNRRVA
jgi:hypothetical protein